MHWEKDHKTVFDGDYTLVSESDAGNFNVFVNRVTLTTLVFLEEADRICNSSVNFLQGGTNLRLVYPVQDRISSGIEEDEYHRGSSYFLREASLAYDVDSDVYDVR